ncbi:MAG TPA: hypothetical protein VN651_19040 [Gemmatimonadaceae bacterium]|nr:hypothetical protein [Gemmatimonadaceae bacterium]
MTTRLLALALSLSVPAASAASQLARRYAAGDTIGYVMDGLNSEGGRDTIRYRATAAGIVTRDSTGRYAEQLTWTHLDRNGSGVPLDPRRARQTLSLAPEWQLLPDLRDAAPELIGPMLDLFTYYVDAKLAVAQPSVRSPGDSVLLPLGVGGSWADGRSVLIGKDAVDFEIKVLSVAGDRATVQVRHVPPQANKLDLPAAWMNEPVATLPNNWVEVVERTDGHYRARVGAESFTVELQLSRKDGRLLSATMQNPVAVVERDCEDRALSVCGPPRRYLISRVIMLQGR